MKKVVILSGVSGSGKSYYALKLSCEHRSKYGGRSTIVSADRFYYENGEYRFDSKLLPNAHANCFRQFIDALEFNDDLIIVDNTNTTLWEISPYVLGATAFGYEPEIVTVLCPLDIASKRNVHGVPESVILSQFNRLMERQFPKNWVHKTIGEV